MPAVQRNCHECRRNEDRLAALDHKVDQLFREASRLNHQSQTFIEKFSEFRNLENQYWTIRESACAP